MRRRFAPQRVRDEVGAVAVMVGAISLVLVLVAAFAVDLGMQRVARRDMQSLADVIALDLSRELNGGPASSYTNLQALANASANRNKGTLGDPPQVLPKLGIVDDQGDFTPVSSGAEIPNAVRVEAATSVGFAFVPGSGGAVRAAVGTQDKLACFRLGSFAVGVNSANSPLLNALIGDALGLGVLGYDGLANANVDLLGLSAALGVGTVDELIALPAVSVGNLAVAAATVLQNNGGDAADITLLNSIGANVGLLANVTVGEILGISNGNEASLETTVNVLDLIAGAAFLSNGQNFLAIPGLQTNLGLTGTGLTSSLQIIDAPRRVCGRVNEAVVSSSQTKLTVDGTLLNPPKILGLTAKVGLNLQVDLASGTGTLRDIRCSDGSSGAQEGIDVEVQNALTKLALTLTVNLKGDLSLGLGLIKVEIDVPIGAGTTRTGSETAQIRVPPMTYVSEAEGATTSTAVETGIGSIGLTGLAVVGTPTIKATLLGLPVALPIPIGDILTPLTSLIVNPLIASLDQTLLGPLTQLLGVNVAGSDVFGIRSPDCKAATLVGGFQP